MPDSIGFSRWVRRTSAALPFLIVLPCSGSRERTAAGTAATAVRTTTTPFSLASNPAALSLCDSSLPRLSGARSDHVGVSINAEGLYDLDKTASALDQLAQTRVGWLRIPVSWPRVESVRGTYSWAETDSLVHMARARDFNVLLYFMHTPDWAAPANNFSLPAARAQFLPPANLAAFRAFVEATVRRYGHDVHAWEIWNEPSFGFNGDCRHGAWCGSPDQFAELLNVGYAAVKSVAPQDPVLIGGLVLSGKAIKQDFLGSILDNRQHPAASSFDIANFHSYGDVGLISQRLGLLRSKLARSRSPKPVWLTETGFGSDTPGDLAAQTRYLCEAFTLAKDGGIDKAFWFKLFDRESQAGRADEIPYYRSGVLDSQLRRKPAFDALAAAAAHW